MSDRRHKVLYVEDNPVNRALVRRILTSAGYTVLEAEDGLSGIQIAAQERPDLILMDIMLPALDGHQVTTRLKSLPELSDVPVVALTAYTMEGTRERALIAGCDGFIPKPIDADLLPDQVAEFLAGKREEIESGAEEQLTLQQEYTQELVIQLENRVRELQKSNAELRHADELKSRFIAMASHELKTPLAVIHGYLTILQARTGHLEDMMDEAARLSLLGIGKGVGRFRAIIEEMLDVVRLEGKTLKIHQAPIIIREIVTNAVHSMEPAARERHLTVEVGSMQGLPVLSADAKRLNQVFVNLLSNAIKYTPNGGQITISARVTRGSELTHYNRPASSDHDFVHIVVQDTGIGIAPEEQERIFDLFYEVQDISVHSTSKTRFMGGGLGLGLAIARGLIEAHGGFLWAESEGFDKERCPGSSFHVLLPIKARHYTPAGTKKPSLSIGESTNRVVFRLEAFAA